MQTEEDFLAGLSTHPSKAELTLVFKPGQIKYDWVELKIDDLPALEFGGYRRQGLKKALNLVRYLKKTNKELETKVNRRGE